MRLRHPLALLALPAALVLASCAPAPAVSTHPAAEPSASAHAQHDTMSPAAQLPPGAKHTLADAQFMEHMIHHHAQALEMAALIPARSTRGDLRLLGERITVSQQDEIAQMQRWLRTRGHPVPDVSGAHAAHAAPVASASTGGMRGMASREELDRLAASRGIAFERLFLELMIRHHEGAIEMVRALFSSPGAAQETVTWSIASEAEADQQMEIGRMRALLASLPSAPAAP